MGRKRKPKIQVPEEIRKTSAYKIKREKNNRRAFLSRQKSKSGKLPKPKLNLNLEELTIANLTLKKQKDLLQKRLKELQQLFISKQL